MADAAPGRAPTPAELLKLAQETGQGYYRVELRMTGVLPDSGPTGWRHAVRVAAADWPAEVTEQGAIRGTLGLLGVDEELPSRHVTIEWMTLFCSTMAPSQMTAPTEKPTTLNWGDLADA